MDKFEESLAMNRELLKANKKLRNEMSFNNQASSTAFPEDNQSQQMLRMLNETIANRQVPITASALSPCVPQDGGEIQITDWECWKKRFEAWLKASNIHDPVDQQTYFDVYAGDKLAIALMTAPEISNAWEEGYKLTVRQLDAVFKSRSSSFALKKDFRSMAQQKSETNVGFLSRLMKAALRIWDRTDPLIDSEIMLTMAVNSTNVKMQEFALRISSDGSVLRNNYEDLVNQARLVDSMVELKSSSESRVLAVSDRQPYVPRPTYNGPTYNNGQDAKRGGDKNQSRASKDRGTRQSFNNSGACFRCGLKGHSPFDCRHLNENCRFCRARGHSIDVCRTKERAARSDGEDSSAKKVRVNSEKDTESSQQKVDASTKVISDT